MQFDVREPELASDAIAVSLPQFRVAGASDSTKRSQGHAASQAQLPAAPAHIRAGGRMMDSHGRTILDLRISITDRCNFRCVYCMEPDVQFQPRENVLTPGEIIRMARVAQSLGVRKIRLTGGEPTLHPQLTEIISGIRARQATAPRAPCE